MFIFFNIDVNLIDMLKTIDPDVDGLPTEAIKKYTGLTDEEIKKL